MPRVFASRGEALRRPPAPRERRVAGGDDLAVLEGVLTGHRTWIGLRHAVVAGFPPDHEAREEMGATLPLPAAQALSQGFDDAVLDSRVHELTELGALVVWRRAGHDPRSPVDPSPPDQRAVVLSGLRKGGPLDPLGVGARRREVPVVEVEEHRIAGLLRRIQRRLDLRRRSATDVPRVKSISPKPTCRALLGALGGNSAENCSGGPRITRYVGSAGAPAAHPPARTTIDARIDSMAFPQGTGYHSSSTASTCPGGAATSVTRAPSSTRTCAARSAASMRALLGGPACPSAASSRRSA